MLVKVQDMASGGGGVCLALVNVAVSAAKLLEVEREVRQHTPDSWQQVWVIVTLYVGSQPDRGLAIYIKLTSFLC